jgi:hypothetical protein
MDGEDPEQVSAATAERTAERAAAAVRPAEFQAALDRALEAAARDDRVRPLLAATKMRMRLEFSDCELALNLNAADPEQGGLAWSFGDDPGWRPKLVLRMDAAIANRYLQGRESLAIALARGQAHFRGDSKAALLYLPATRLLCDSYRRVIASDYPDLAVS